MKANHSKDLWINPRRTTVGPGRNHQSSAQKNITPYHGARFLELADIALGLKKPAQKTHAIATAGTHSTARKSKPYST